MKVERITTYERFVEEKKEWNTLLSNSGQNCPFLTHQWFDAWWQSFGQGEELEILFFWDDSGSLAGIAPLMVAGETPRFMANHEVTDYCDFISCVDKHDDFYESLLDYFHRDFSKYSCMEFINISESSPTLSRLPGLAAKHNFVYEVQVSEVVPVLILPGSYEEYMQALGRKNRHELRRKNRKWETLGHIRTQRITEPEQLRLAIESFISLHKNSGSEKQEFWKKEGIPDFFKELVHLFSKEYWVELHSLHVENRMVAALLNFLYEDSVYFYNVAYDREYSAYSPGFYLFDCAIKRAVDQGFKVADFLRGREKYKYFFGAKESKIYSLNLKHTEDNT